MNNDKMIIDLWVLITMLALCPIVLADDMNVSQSVNHNLELIYVIIGIASFGLIGFIIIKCTKLEKYRYLVIYTSCQKVDPIINHLMIIGVVLSIIIGLYLYGDYADTIVVMVYYIWVATISLKFKDGDSNE